MDSFDFLSRRISRVPGDGIDPEILHTGVLRYFERLCGWGLCDFLFRYPGSQKTVMNKTPFPGTPHIWREKKSKNPIHTAVVNISEHQCASPQSISEKRREVFPRSIWRSFLWASLSTKPNFPPSYAGKYAHSFLLFQGSDD